MSSLGARALTNVNSPRWTVIYFPPDEPSAFHETTTVFVSVLVASGTAWAGGADFERSSEVMGDACVSERREATVMLNMNCILNEWN